MDAIWRDGAIGEIEGAKLAAVGEETLALAEQHRERERACLVDETCGEQ